MKQRHYNIPIFIPELACPFQCIYCNQQKISGRLKIPSKEEIIKIIDDHISTIPVENSEVELAFFGGNFTGIDKSEQIRLLQLVNPYLKSGQIGGIRLSTRPDYIDEDILKMLKGFGVKTIEIGAQSMDDKVLRFSKRGHTAKHTERAAHLVLKAGFSLGLQMMIGLPGDSLESAIYTANHIVEIGADNTRIYPTLVIHDTVMENMYHEGRFKPLSLEEAVSWSKELLLIFEKANVKVIKLGLHPSEGLLSGKDLIAGPFHLSFRELVLTEIWNDILKPLLNSDNPNEIEIHVPADQINYAVGYGGRNKKMLLGRHGKVKFATSANLAKREFRVC